MNIDISMVIDLVSISVRVQFFYNKKIVSNRLKISNEIIYRLVKSVAGRNRAVAGVVLLSDIIEPS
jgi:hypothetical protein